MIWSPALRPRLDTGSSGTRVKCLVGYPAFTEREPLLGNIDKMHQTRTHSPVERAESPIASVSDSAGLAPMLSSDLVLALRHLSDGGDEVLIRSWYSWRRGVQLRELRECESSCTRRSTRRSLRNWNPLSCPCSCLPTTLEFVRHARTVKGPRTKDGIQRACKTRRINW